MVDLPAQKSWLMDSYVDKFKEVPKMENGMMLFAQSLYWEEQLDL